MQAKNAIALMITLFFIMAISVLVGIGLSEVKKISTATQKERFLLQSRVIADDVMRLLKSSQDLDMLVGGESNEAFFLFVEQSGFIPLNTKEIEVVLEISSARSKININSLKKDANSFHLKRVEALQRYLNYHMVDMVYADLLLDAMSGIKEDYSYMSDLFRFKPHLFRDYIASKNHLEEINRFFKDNYRFNTLERVDFDTLFSYNKKIDTKIDLNFATPNVWMFMLGCDHLRAQEIASKRGFCTDLDCFELAEPEKELVNHFNTSFFEPIIDVKVTMYQNDMKAKMSFEYDMKLKKGSNFVYEI